jgi:hypothetical protein
MKRLALLVVTVTLFMAACGPKIYKSDNFGSALARHKTVAILPAEVTIQLRPNESKKITAQEMNDMQTKSAYDIQDKMYGWFLRRSDKFHYTVTFQDINKTNAKLKDAGIAYEDLRSKDRADLAKILGVDAVMQGKTVSEKPMSEGAAVAVGVIFGAWGSTNKVQTAINIHDGKSGELLWKYDYEASGSIGSSTTRLVDALMKNATKKFPYSAK